MVSNHPPARGPQPVEPRASMIHRKALQYLGITGRSSSAGGWTVSTAATHGPKSPHWIT